MKNPTKTFFVSVGLVFLLTLFLLGVLIRAHYDRASQEHIEVQTPVIKGIAPKDLRYSIYPNTKDGEWENPSAIQAKDASADRALPPIGSRIRVTSNKLAPGWHVAMLNRYRTKRVFYEILIFGPNSIKSTLNPDNIARIQVSTIYNRGSVGNFDPTKTLYPDEEWIDVSLNALRAANKRFREKGPTNP